jgi:hypothetical protein
MDGLSCASAQIVTAMVVGLALAAGSASHSSTRLSLKSDKQDSDDRNRCEISDADRKQSLSAESARDHPNTNGAWTNQNNDRDERQHGQHGEPKNDLHFCRTL